MRSLIAILVLALLVVQGRLWISAQGIPELQRLQVAVHAQHDENAELRRMNDALAAEVADLREGLEAAEERARADLGLIRQNETFFQLVVPR